YVEYSHSLWWQFALIEDAPRSLRATVGAAVLLLLVGVARLMRPAEPQADLPKESELADAARIAALAPRTAAWLSLLGDKSLIFNPQRSAFLMYAIEGASWVVLGDPVGPRAEAAELAWRFREQCDRHAAWPVFYQVAAENLPLYLDLGLSLLKLGEEARVPLAQFGTEGGANRWIRHTISKADHAGCSFEVVPQADVESLLNELQQVSDEWLTTRNAQEKGFSLGYFRRDYLRRFPMAVVRHDERIVGFANVLAG